MGGQGPAPTSPRQVRLAAESGAACGWGCSGSEFRAVGASRARTRGGNKLTGQWRCEPERPPGSHSAHTAAQRRRYLQRACPTTHRSPPTHTDSPMLSSLPAPTRPTDEAGGAGPSSASGSPARLPPPVKEPPQYGRRAGFVPRSQADFGDGGELEGRCVCVYATSCARGWRGRRVCGAWAWGESENGGERAERSGAERRRKFALLSLPASPPPSPPSACAVQAEWRDDAHRLRSRPDLPRGVTHTHTRSSHARSLVLSL